MKQLNHMEWNDNSTTIFIPWFFVTVEFKLRYAGIWNKTYFTCILLSIPKLYIHHRMQETSLFLLKYWTITSLKKKEYFVISIESYNYFWYNIWLLNMHIYLINHLYSLYLFKFINLRMYISSFFMIGFVK